jgi:CheY-like chemotaxis protein
MIKQILFVDNNPAVAGPVNSMLEDMGHHVRMETSGMEALSVFARNPGKYDLIITELGMPDISGFLLVEKFLKMRSDIPIVLLTGIEGQEQSNARESGIRWFGIKPLSITELADTVEKALVE